MDQLYVSVDTAVYGNGHLLLKWLILFLEFLVLDGCWIWFMSRQGFIYWTYLNTYSIRPSYYQTLGLVLIYWGISSAILAFFFIFDSYEAAEFFGGITGFMIYATFNLSMLALHETWASRYYIRPIMDVVWGTLLWFIVSITSKGLDVQLN